MFSRSRAPGSQYDLTGWSAPFTHRPDRRDLAGFAVGGLLLACLATVDILLGEGQSIAGSFVLPALLVALTGSVQATTALALVAVVLAVASGSWNAHWGDAEHLARSAVVLLGGGLAIGAAIVRWRSLIDARRLELLERIAAIADGSLPLDRTLERVTDVTVPALADLCMVDAIGAAGMSRMAVRAAEFPDGDRIEERLRRRRPSIPSYLRESGRGSRPDSHFVARADDTVIRGLAHDDGEDLAFLRSLGVCSFVILPLYARGRTFATLTLVTTRWSGRSLEPRDVRFAEILSGRIALALDNAGLFSDLESVERRLDAVMNLIDEAVFVHDAGGRIVFANAAAARWLERESVEQLLDSPSAALATAHLRAEDGSRLGSTAEVLARAGAPDERWSAVVRVERPDRVGEGWANLRYEPITGPHGEVLFGVATVADITPIKRAEFATTMLAETARLLDSTRDFDLTVEGIAEMAVPRFAEFCAVLVPGEQGSLDSAAVVHSDPRRLELIRRLQAEHPIHIDDDRATSRVFREGRPVVLEIDDEYIDRTEDEERASLLRRLDFGSVLIVPLVAGAKVVGVVTYANQRGSRRFDETDAGLGTEIGNRAGLALENARRSAEEAEVSKLLQLGLRPTAFPATPGWLLASMYKSAGEVTEVGGDFYDAFPVGGGWVVAIGDVVGRGAAAASLTALARHTLRTATRFTNETDEALRQLHEAFAEQEGDQLCSVAIAILPDSEDDPAEVSVLSAGHPLPLHLSAADRHVREVGVPGPLLGVFEPSGWPLERISLEPGDQLILYTDGVPEAKGRAERFGAERLRATVAEATDPESTVRRVELALNEFCPYGSQDDAAVVAIQRLPRLVRASVAEGRPNETPRYFRPHVDPAAR